MPSPRSGVAGLLHSPSSPQSAMTADDGRCGDISSVVKMPGVSIADAKGMATGAYSMNPGDSVGNWTVPPNGVDQDHFSGYRGVLFVNPQGQAVYAFSGTDSPVDGVADLDQGLTGPQGDAQYQEALQNTRRIQSQYGSNLVAVTGHSLGGGLSNYVAAETGVNAIGFNAAPIGGLYPLTGSTPTGSVLNINNAHDIVSKLPGVQYGTVCEVQDSFNHTLAIAPHLIGNIDLSQPVSCAPSESQGAASAVRGFVADTANTVSSGAKSAASAVGGFLFGEPAY